MPERKREVSIAPAAIENMHNANPSVEELEAIKRVIQELEENPTLGFKIAFANPTIYRLDIGRFRIHYDFDDTKVRVAFIGAY